MTKKSNKNRKSVEEIMLSAQAITEAGPIDHHSQTGSWMPETNADEALTGSIDDVTLDGVAEMLDATEAETIPAEAIETSAVETTGTDQIVTFDKTLTELDPMKVDEMVVELSSALDDRVEFEERVGPDNLSIHKTLKKVRAAFTANKNAARVLLAVNTDSAFINRSISEGARYNVYALGKLADIVKGLTDGQISNAINLACMKSLFAFRTAGVPFTSQLARAAASDKIRDIDPSVRKHLVRHTVSASTAPTQASSTMQALETLGIVKRTGTRRDAVYTLNDTPAVQKLESKLFGEARAA
jgi:hypothetical protein